MADDQVRTSSKGCTRDSKMEVIVTRWYVSWSNIWCCCSLSKVVVLSRITTTNCSTVLLLVPTSPSSSLKAIRTFFISLQIASHHNVSPLAPSSLFASATDLGTRMPNLWVQTQYFDLTFAIIRFRFLRTHDTHHANAGSWEILARTEFSAS